MVLNKFNIVLISGLITLAGCATQPRPFEDNFPPPSAGLGGEVIVDDSASTAFFDGPWKVSSQISGYLGEGYHFISKGNGDSFAVWNLELIDYFDIYVRWTSHANRASNARYEVHHLDDSNRLVVSTVTIDQRTGGGEWFKLGTYKISSLTGRVQIRDDANGYVIADAVKFVPSAGLGGEVIVDDSDSTAFFDGPWAVSSYSRGYLGEGYHFIPKGNGDNFAVWNLELIDYFDIYVRWTSHSNRASNARYEVHHLDDSNRLVVSAVTIDQRSGGGEWFKLGTYKISSLTGQVQVSDDADRFVIADAVKFVQVYQLATESTVLDSDGDGMDDEFEKLAGLNPNDAKDGALDLDGDGVTNLEEYYVGTDPTRADTDSDGIPDGYELSYGLDPTINDAMQDLDGDGFLNIDEYSAGSDPSDEASLPASGPTLSWSTPTSREDGSVLYAPEIDHYEIQYFPVYAAEIVTLDDDSGFFNLVGSTVAVSSVISGYLGAGYHPIAPGDGSVFAKWSFFDLNPGIPYALEARWTASSNRSQKATYQIRFNGEVEETSIQSSAIDQRTSGGQWIKVAEFTPSDSSAVVELPSKADGYVIADAVRLNPKAVSTMSTMIVPGSQQSVKIEEKLPAGSWSFQIRTIDSDGAASRFSDPVTMTVQ
jgi:hypothetical protein